MKKALIAKKALAAFVLVAGVCALGAQNAESKSADSKNIDFSAKGSEKPSAESSKIAKIELIKPSGFCAFETIGDSTSSAAFGKITNDSDAEISLKAARIISEVGAKAEIHGVKMDKSGAMQMYALKSLKIAPKSSIELAPKGNHIMLISLPKALKDGKKIKIALVFGADSEVDSSARDFTLELEIPIIKRPDSMPNHAAHANHSHAHDNRAQDNNAQNTQNAHSHDAHQSHKH